MCDCTHVKVCLGRNYIFTKHWFLNFFNHFFLEEKTLGDLLQFVLIPETGWQQEENVFSSLLFLYLSPPSNWPVGHWLGLQDCSYKTKSGRDPPIRFTSLTGRSVVLSVRQGHKNLLMCALFLCTGSGMSSEQMICLFWQFWCFVRKNGMQNKKWTSQIRKRPHQII